MAEDRARREAEDIAVPKMDIAEEAVEDIGQAGADVLPDDPSGRDRADTPLYQSAGRDEGDDTGSPAGDMADVDWSAGDARPEPTPAGPTGQQRPRP